jgi:hypothetical protein
LVAKRTGFALRKWPAHRCWRTRVRWSYGSHFKLFAVI